MSNSAAFAVAKSILPATVSWRRLMVRRVQSGADGQLWTPSEVLPKGFHRIRHYGLFANANRADNIARARELLNVPPPVKEADEDKPAADESQVLPCPCPRCGGRLIIIETFAEGTQPASWPQRWVPNPRDFVPWRFSDACCRCVGLRNLHIKPSHYLHINCREQVQQTTGRPRPTCGRVIPTFCSDYWHVLAPLRSSQ